MLALVSELCFELVCGIQVELANQSQTDATRLGLAAYHYEVCGLVVCSHAPGSDRERDAHGVPPSATPTGVRAAVGSIGELGSTYTDHTGLSADFACVKSWADAASDVCTPPGVR